MVILILIAYMDHNMTKIHGQFETLNVNKNLGDNMTKIHGHIGTLTMTKILGHIALLPYIFKEPRFYRKLP